MDRDIGTADAAALVALCDIKNGDDGAGLWTRCVMGKEVAHGIEDRNCLAVHCNVVERLEDMRMGTDYAVITVCGHLPCNSHLSLVLNELVLLAPVDAGDDQVSTLSTGLNGNGFSLFGIVILKEEISSLFGEVALFVVMLCGKGHNGEFDAVDVDELIALLLGLEGTGLDKTEALNIVDGLAKAYGAGVHVVVVGIGEDVKTGLLDSIKELNRSVAVVILLCNVFFGSVRCIREDHGLQIAHYQICLLKDRSDLIQLIGKIVVGAVLSLLDLLFKAGDVTGEHDTDIILVFGILVLPVFALFDISLWLKDHIGHADIIPFFHVVIGLFDLIFLQKEVVFINHSKYKRYCSGAGKAPEQVSGGYQRYLSMYGFMPLPSGR